MRINSPKQTEASRENGSHSKGPKSFAGKARVRLNAMKYGLHSKDLVLESAGEKMEHFDRLRNEVAEHFHCEDPVGAFFVDDLATNQWRVLRVRRAETAHLKNEARRRSTLKSLQDSDKTGGLKIDFWRLYRQLSKDPLHMFENCEKEVLELEAIRQKLASTSAGLSFLIGQVEGMGDTVRFKERLSMQDVVLLLACAGFGNEHALAAYGFASSDVNVIKGSSVQFSKTLGLYRSFGLHAIPFNGSPLSPDRPPVPGSEGSEAATERLPRPESERAESGPRLDKNGNDGARIAMEEIRQEAYATAVKTVRRLLITRMRFVKRAEKVEAETLDAAVTSQIPDTFARAETTYMKRAYRAFELLNTLNTG